MLVNISESFVAQRRRLGIDKQDERWDGQWHFVNPPHSWAPLLNGALLVVLGPLAERVGLRPYGGAGIFAHLESDWRVPDEVYARPDQQIEEGLVGAELVVEIRSPDDESYAKLPFYAGRGITEALIVHRDRRFELFRLDGAGAYQPVKDGRSTVLGVTFSTVEGPKLRIEWDGGSAVV